MNKNKLFDKWGELVMVLIIIFMLVMACTMFVNDEAISKVITSTNQN